jgi:transposase-like protein
MNLVDVSREFRTEDDALAFLEKMRWPDGIVRCPTCGNNKVSHITRQTAGKNKRTRIYQCLEKTCRQQFSATSGTIFNDSHIPLTTWFQAVALLVEAKKGMSALQLKRTLWGDHKGSYKTAWYLCHRIRESMKDLFPTKLDGTVQMDELYIGGKAKRKGPKRPRSRFDTVLGMIEQGGGRVRYFHTPDLRAKTLKPIIDRHISGNVHRIVTDCAMVYPFAFDKKFNARHRTVNHSIMEWVSPEGFTTNAIESVSRAEQN